MTAAVGRRRVRVDGIVQGVGFRPYVHQLATSLGLAGWVGNDERGVVVEVEGDEGALDAFLRRLPLEAPPPALVEGVVAQTIEVTGDSGFRIAPSSAGARRAAVVPPDAAPCEACLAEIRDPADRRHGHAFASCTRCGPRFSIVTGVPYDRATTTMADFPLCHLCAAEYGDADDRRFHAEPTCCPSCGPALEIEIGPSPGAADIAAGREPIAAAAALVSAGRIVAVKGVGGYHLAALAADEAAVAELRRRKQRDEKPFALLVATVDDARALCHVDETAEAVLRSPAAPIVLLPRREAAQVAESVAPGNRWLGVMLPASPLHHLLVTAVGAPLVLTSGNISDEPIAHDDDDARTRLQEVADAFLLHDRGIHTRVDDSVVRVVDGHVMPVRRSRGYAPAPVRVPWPFPRHVLAVGAQLKSTFCLAKERRAFVSHHIGDLETWQVLQSFEAGIEHHRRLFDIQPEVVAHDLHPEYLSTAYAHALEGVELLGVQHHHAHVAACLADNGEDGPVIGVAFDGLGLGTDGDLWGGELLIADTGGFERAGHLSPVRQPGGDAATKAPWRMAVAHVVAALGPAPAELAVAARHPDEWEQIVALCESGVQSPMTTSVGRLFDAVASLLGVRDDISYEGQAAIELEQVADPDEAGAYQVTLERGDGIVLSGADLVRGVVADVADGVGIATIAARFHNGLSDAVVAACDELRVRQRLATVALSGGVFQNAVLHRRLVGGLRATGFRVLTHRHVPPNDAGISLGQAVVAAARDRSRS